MSDYGVGWPLWNSEGAMDPSSLDTPDELAARLNAWQEHFEQRFHYEHGWRSPDDAAVYAEEGKMLQRLLTAEVGRWFNVELDLWPITDRSPGG
ncbi:hypothetical protein [Nonomuraea sp. NPDC049400]|uniref:hypothetical protein n=1 Tax=Nonomuraea sp. NPDC049400 TaxID=3364352 RepID=UPI0037ACA7B8